MRTISTNKKGQLASLGPAVLVLVFAAVLLVFGIVMTQELADTQTNTGALGCNATSSINCGEAFDAGNQTVAGLGTFSNFWEIIVLAVVITIVIGLLLTVFGGSKRR